MRHAALMALGLLAFVTACQRPDSGMSETVLVSAASSLTESFTEIEAAFQDANPDVDVVLNFAGSSTLREQVLAGAPVDVFASANQSIMGEVLAAGSRPTVPTVFASNRLMIAVPTDNPAGVTALEDFAEEDLLLGLCAEGVPCGDFARIALTRAGIAAAIDTNEPNVRALLTKVQIGELDAGITYESDVASSSEVKGVAIPEDQNVVAEYPLAVLADAPNKDGGERFMEFVLSDEGQLILADNGFGTP